MTIGLLYISVFGQGYNLKFNRVIDTIISIQSSCTDIYPPIYGSALTVPNGVVWKITSLIGTPASNRTMYATCGSSSSQANKGFCNFMKQSGSQEFALFSTGGDSQFNLPLWVNSQTTFKWKAWSINSSYDFNRTWDIDHNAHLSIIEFLLVP